jgi:hypothetical protein
MALCARDGVAPSLYELAIGCQEYGAYTDEPGRPNGLIYQPFVDYAWDRHRLRAGVITNLDPARLIAELDEGKLVIASVHPEIRRPRNAPPGTGGHLVLVTAYTGGLVTFHDPSGHTPEAAVARLPMPVFDCFAAHRGITLSL